MQVSFINFVLIHYCLAIFDRAIAFTKFPNQISWFTDCTATYNYSYQVYFGNESFRDLRIHVGAGLNKLADN